MMKKFFTVSGKSFFLGFSSAIGIGFLSIWGIGSFYQVNWESAANFIKDYSFIKKEYFRNISDDALFLGASKGMVSALNDPYTTLISGDKFKSFMQTTSGEYAGIGVTVGADTFGNYRIYYVFPNSPAEKMGIQIGDIISKVDGDSTKDISLNETVAKVRGVEGTSVALSLLRGEKEFDVTVDRAKVELPSVSSKMVSNDIGYIYIGIFSKHTGDEFGKALSELKSNGMKKLIVDVRMNPGGLIDSVLAVANQILTKGPIVSFEKKGETSTTYSIDGIQDIFPMVILIDKNSASAAEILAGAIQDKKEGTVIGETSFGKGTIQEVLNRDNTSALKISIAEYKTAGNRSIDKVGITPDIPVKQEGIPFDFETDSVFLKAIEVLNKNEA